MNRILAWFLVALIFAMSGPLQAATMASARGFEKSLYGRSAAWADKYAYCSGDPINRVDPDGLRPDLVQDLMYGQRQTHLPGQRGGRVVAGLYATPLLLTAPEIWYGISNWFLSSPVTNGSLAVGTAYSFASGDPSNPIGEVGALGAAMTRSEIEAAKKAVGAFGARNGLKISMTVGEEVLPAGKLAVYRAISKTQGALVLGENPTWYEFFHEFGHALDHAHLGYDKFLKLGAIGREKSAYNFMTSVFGNIMTEAEKNHARSQFP